ncbi:hypothetical protein AB0N89_10170 [Amycolatopsis sp. NPDC089917]|uniref:hypothetical protein n=1 Tax=Amycolatopsis sp. NPDC089917 TaxID=3155187 RepID=UPI003425DA2C
MSPPGTFDRVTVGEYGPEVSAVEWESLFTGLGVQELSRAGEPHYVTRIENDGHYVFVVSERLQALLATADERQRDDVARRWSRLREADGEFIEEDEAVRHLAELASLARAASGNGERLYCSVR